MKRFLDVFLAILTLIVFSPLILIIIIILKRILIILKLYIMTKVKDFILIYINMK